MDPCLHRDDGGGLGTRRRPHVLGTCGIVAWDKHCDRRGSAHLFGRGEAACDLGRASPGYCLQACPCAVSGRGGRGVWKGSRLKPLEVLSSSIARIATCTRCHPEAAGFAGGYPIGPKAQRRPHSSPTRRRDHRAANHTLRSFTLGRRYRLMHAEELRAGHVRSPGLPSLRT